MWEERRAHRASRSTPFAAYESALSGHGYAFASAFLNWFKEREDLENEQRLDSMKKGRVLGPGDEQTSAVREAIGLFVPDLKNVRIRQEPPPWRMVVDKERWRAPGRSGFR